MIRSLIIGPDEARANSNPECPACAVKRLHTDEELDAHKYVGHGFSPDTGWTHKDLKPKVREVVKP